MKKEQQLAHSIMEKVGGKENIIQLNHCMTRVRLNVKDESLVDLKGLKQIPGVMGVVEDDTLQIVVGPGTVNKVADEISKETGLRVGEVAVNPNLTAQDRQAALKKKNSTPLKNGLRRVGNIFIPLIPALVASGIINGAANFARNAGVNPEETWMAILLFLGGGIFAYLGVLVGWNTAKEFGGTPALGAIAGIIIINPALATITLFGEPLVPGRGGLIAVILAAWFMVVVERSARKIVPNSIDIILTPLITVLVVGFATLFIIQPVGGLLSTGITEGITVCFRYRRRICGGYSRGILLATSYGWTPSWVNTYSYGIHQHNWSHPYINHFSNGWSRSSWCCYCYLCENEKQSFAYDD